VNGERTGQRAFRPDDVSQPHDDYAHSELEAERRLSAVEAASGVTVAVVQITGITGQDGAYLAEFLLSKGYVVHGVKRRLDLVRQSPQP